MSRIGSTKKIYGLTSLFIFTLQSFIFHIFVCFCLWRIIGCGVRGCVAFRCAAGWFRCDSWPTGGRIGMAECHLRRFGAGFRPNLVDQEETFSAGMAGACVCRVDRRLFGMFVIHFQAAMGGSCSLFVVLWLLGWGWGWFWWNETNSGVSGLDGVDLGDAYSFQMRFAGFGNGGLGRECSGGWRGRGDCEVAWVDRR